MFICDVLAYKPDNYGDHNKELLIIQLFKEISTYEYSIKKLYIRITAYVHYPNYATKL